MRTRSRALALGTVLTICFPALSLWAQAADPATGTWELNLAKSKFSPGPAPKSLMRTYEFTGEELKFTEKGIDSDGKPTLAQFTGKYDGKDYPVNGFPGVDAISAKRVDARTVEYTLKNGGKVVVTGTRVVSQDGKTLTNTSKGKNAKGQEVNNVAVYDKR